MATRLELESKLRELLGSDNVYYQPLESVKMNYPAIKYSKSKIDVKRANNAIYIQSDRYDVIVIAKTPDHPVINKLLQLPYCSFDRHYKSDNLNHDSLSLYW